MKTHIQLILVISLLTTAISYADTKVELEVTVIKGNDELPKILYIVPWKDIEQTKNEEQKLVLHSLFGDLFEPVYPEK